MIRRTLLSFLLLTGVATAPQAQENTDSPPVPADLTPYILTPPAPETPRINSARIFGVRPGSELRYMIAASGVRPMTFSADNLPKGVSIDPSTGILTGHIQKAGTYHVTLKATNTLGSDRRDLRIVVGDRIALTPPMGWNSWNCWGVSVSQDKVLSSARALVEKGLANYGWSYINIDDGWQGTRSGKELAISPNRKFSDIKGLADQIHGMGLKLGIYSAPWVGTYSGHIGTQCENPEGHYDYITRGLNDENYKVEDPEKKIDESTYYYHGDHSFAAADARQWAAWGIDYLKYDWYPNDLYYAREMDSALRATGRDIVLSLSNEAPYADAQGWMRTAQCWRTTSDIRDDWGTMTDIGLQPQERWAPFHGPGHWADADMLVVGYVGWGPELRPTRLTPDEQYFHVTLWTLLASPMLIGCDIARMDDFTVSLLCNHEVNDILQDPLGHRATPFERGDGWLIYAKILEDGSMAVGLFNTSTEPRTIGITPESLGLWSDQITVRDLWRQQDITQIGCRERFESEVAPHGVRFVRFSPGNTDGKPVSGKKFK